MMCTGGSDAGVGGVKREWVREIVDVYYCLYLWLSILWGKKGWRMEKWVVPFPRFQISVATGDQEIFRASLHLTFWANYLEGRHAHVHIGITFLFSYIIKFLPAQSFQARSSNKSPYHFNHEAPSPPASTRRKVSTRHFRRHLQRSLQPN